MSDSAALWTAACQATLFITDSQSLLKLMSIKSVTPSNHLILCCPLLLLPSIFLSIRVFLNKSVLHIKWPKYWSFSISPSSDCSRLISFRRGSLLISPLYPHPLDSSSLSPPHAPTLTHPHSMTLSKAPLDSPLLQIWPLHQQREQPHLGWLEMLSFVFVLDLPKETLHFRSFFYIIG